MVSKHTVSSQYVRDITLPDAAKLNVEGEFQAQALRNPLAVNSTFLTEGRYHESAFLLIQS